MLTQMDLAEIQEEKTQKYLLTKLVLVCGWCDMIYDVKSRVEFSVSERSILIPKEGRLLRIYSDGDSGYSAGKNPEVSFNKAFLSLWVVRDDLPD